MTIYRRLLRWLAPKLDRCHGAAMEEVFASRRRDARTQGRWRLARFCVREAGGLAAVALSERCG